MRSSGIGASPGLGGSGSISETGRSVSTPAACRLSAWSSATRKSCRLVDGVGRGLAVDLAGDDELDQRLGERLHVEELALGDRVRDLLGAALADQVGDARVVDHHLDGGDAAALLPRQQPLADDAAQDAREDGADLLLLDRREELDHPADRLGGVDRVHRREDEVAGLGRLERRLGGLGVAELADQDHVGVLAQHAPDRGEERLGVEPDLALVDDAALVGVEDLDRVLDRDDVLAPRAVDVVDHRRERGRLARAGRAGDEHEAAMLLGQALRRLSAGAAVSKLGTSFGITRKANEIEPRWR